MRGKERERERESRDGPIPEDVEEACAKRCM